MLAPNRAGGRRGGARRGAEVRTLIDHSIGPVWEANHVWLILVIVLGPGILAGILSIALRSVGFIKIEWKGTR